MRVGAGTEPGAAPMRCVRRRSAHLNKARAATLYEVVAAYAKEKDHHLQALTPALCASTSSQRCYRDQLVAGKYRSPYGCQARMWKMALTDDHGKRCAKGFGAFLTATSAEGLGKGQERKKLHALRTKVNNPGYKKTFVRDSGAIRASIRAGASR